MVTHKSFTEGTEKTEAAAGIDNAATRGQKANTCHDQLVAVTNRLILSTCGLAVTVIRYDKLLRLQ